MSDSFQHQPAAPGKDQRRLNFHDLLRSFRWGGNETDIALITDWVAAAAQPDRPCLTPVIWISGHQGSGKSTLLSGIKALLGSNAELLVGSVHPTSKRWQARMSGTLPLLLDYEDGDYVPLFRALERATQARLGRPIALVTSILIPSIPSRHVMKMTLSAPAREAA